MFEDIMFTFDKNFLRLNNLIGLYKSLSTGSGRRPTNSLDVLRATSVLAHSTLEDYLRNLLMWRLPLQNKDKIIHIPLTGASENGRATKFTLGDLVALKIPLSNQLLLKMKDLHEKTAGFLPSIAQNRNQIGIKKHPMQL